MIADRNINMEKFYSFFSKAESFFQPQIKKQNISLNEYIDKLATKGTIAYIEDIDEIVGAVIGYAHDTQDKTSFITQVYVLPAYRGRGYSRELLVEYCEYCKALNLKGVWLTTRKDNHLAQRVYENAGFVLDYSYINENLLRYQYNLYKD